MVKRQDITPFVVRKVRARTMMRDHKLHGRATLFVALDMLDGSVLGRRRQRPRHQAFIGFLDAEHPLATNRLRALLHKRQTVAILLPGWPLRR